MAVQKSRKTRSKRGMHRSHDYLSKPTLATDNTTGETHRRHHLTKDGYYRGKQIIVPKQVATEKEEGNK
jgi:large subunit ribosomal protein L32